MDNGAVLYPHVLRSLERMKTRVDGSTSICTDNKRLLLEFLVKLEADGTSKAQQLSYLIRLFPLAELICDTTFKDVSKQQMEKVFATWRSRKSYKQASINKTIECLKGFYRWAFVLTSQDHAPECVKWLRKEKEVTDVRPEDLWTEEDITKVLNATRSELYKAMISVAYESGLRPGELRSLRIGDVKFNTDIVRIYCRGKTRRKTGERVVPLVRCYDILKRWIYNHPRKDDQNAWLWTFDKEPLPDRNLRLQLQRLAKKTHISKPSDPYILRHSALTKIYKELPTPLARKISGHVGNSLMVDTYCHLGMSDLEDAVMAMNGKLPKREDKNLTICPKCNSLQDVGAMACKSCGEKFSTKSACEMDEHEQNLIKLAKAVLKRAEQNPEIVDMLLKG